MISALAWVPRGAAKPVAEEPDPTNVELEASEVRFDATQMKPLCRWIVPWVVIVLLNSRSSMKISPGQTVWKARLIQTVMSRWMKLHRSHKPKLWLQQSKQNLLRAKVRL